MAITSSHTMVLVPMRRPPCIRLSSMPRQLTVIIDRRRICVTSEMVPSTPKNAMATSPNHVSTTMNGKGYEPGGISGAGSALSESLARGVDRPRETTMKEPAMGADELGSLVDQAKRLIDLGVPESAQGALSGAELLAAATELTERSRAG